MNGLYIGVRPAVDFITAKNILESLQTEILDVDDYMTIDNGLKIYCGDKTYKIFGGTVIIE